MEIGRDWSRTLQTTVLARTNAKEHHETGPLRSRRTGSVQGRLSPLQPCVHILEGEQKGREQKRMK
eukprot:1158905-Pelagomonas_calceolata.AAC.8